MGGFSLKIYDDYNMPQFTNYLTSFSKICKEIENTSKINIYKKKWSFDWFEVHDLQNLPKIDDIAKQ